MPIPPDERPDHCEFCSAAVEGDRRQDGEALVLRKPHAVLIAPRRHAARWRDLAASERAVLAELIGPAQDECGPGASPRVILDEDGPHVHLRVMRPLVRHAHLPGLPHDGPLISGGEDALRAHLLPCIDRAASIDLAVSFLMQSGVRLILPHLRDMLGRGGKVRILTGDYFGVTEPDALRLILDLDGDLAFHAFQANAIPFHPKAWIFDFDDGTGALLVGSSNLSRSALTSGVEWNLRLFEQGGAAPMAAARSAFEALLARDEVVELTHAWVESYEKRRTGPPVPVAGVPEEPAPEAPTPHPVQAEALAALAATREEGYRAGLVVLATGLGKTFLAAFDSQPCSRVLFVAHRDEILTQAMDAFRAVRPKARLGKYTGESKDAQADILFASVQTLSRAQHRTRFAPDAFDYIVIDEFHHAAAATYRRIIEHFTPDFLLGLTATPDRTDGGDLLGLCENNIVYECDLWAGIERELLSPFRYFGVPDPVEYVNIPWRRGRFDEFALTEAVATEKRAENALQQLAERGGRKALGFCVSVRHADFMAEFARSRGLRAVAVHSGENSAPRASALKALEDGTLDIVFAVDMFNEGVDVPSIDTVLMLRPTESLVIWLQQLGRGLRRSEGKRRLSIIDYIGNHRAFLNKVTAMLRAGVGNHALGAALKAYEARTHSLPPGCEVTYDLAAIEILKKLIRPRQSRSRSEEEGVADFYRDFRDRHGQRPTALEMHNAGFNPAKISKDGWLAYVASAGDMDEGERASYERHAAFLSELERTSMTRTYKMLVIRAMVEAGALPGELPVPDLAARIARHARRNPVVRDDLSVDPDDPKRVEVMLLKHPLPIWAKTEWFELQGDALRTTFSSAGEGRHLASLASEIAEWRIYRQLRGKAPSTDR